jgi:hypothetical protein
MNRKWNFENLARAEKPLLESILVSGNAPEIGALDGYTYCGWNLDPIGKLTGQKFKKCFFSTKDGVYGFNKKVRQDSVKAGGAWNDVQYKGRFKTMGYFKVAYAYDCPLQELTRQYRHLAVFNYNLSLNQGLSVFFKVIRDFMVLPNPDDNSLLLGKAYLHLPGNLEVFACYFLLGYPHKTNHSQFNFNGKIYHL